MIRNDDRVVPQLLGLDRTRSQLRPGNDLTHTCKETKRPHEPQYRARYSSFVSVSADIDTRVQHLLPTLSANDNIEMEVSP